MSPLDPDPRYVHEDPHSVARDRKRAARRRPLDNRRSIRIIAILSRKPRKSRRKGNRKP